MVRSPNVVRGVTYPHKRESGFRAITWYRYLFQNIATPTVNKRDAPYTAKGSYGGVKRAYGPGPLNELTLYLHETYNLAPC